MSAPVIIVETERLILREIEATDAPFLHALLTDADFLANIGDRGVHSVADAERAIAERYRATYADEGFGMYVVEGKAEGTPLGTAGLVRRAGLEQVDLGYAFLPAGRGRGYALEAARAVLGIAADKGIAPVVAIVDRANTASIRVLEALDMVAARTLRLPNASSDVTLYVPRDAAIG